MRFLLALLLLLSSTFLHAQTATDADQLFSKGQYRAAQSIYLNNSATLSVQQLRNLASTFLLADRSKPDYASALTHLKTAAAKGDAASMLDIAQVYGQGLGHPKDTVLAFSWVQKAAATRNGNALFTQGLLYYRGQWTPKNLGMARMSWLMAADSNHRSSIEALGPVYEENADYKTALYWYKRAGDAYAWYRIGNMYREGRLTFREGDLEGAYYRALKGRPDQATLNAVVDSLKKIRKPVAATRAAALVTQLLEQLADGFYFHRGDTIPTRPVFADLAIADGSGMDLDATSARVVFYHYNRPSGFSPAYIRNLQSTQHAGDRNTYLFSGIVDHSNPDRAAAEALFNSWAEALRNGLTAFRFGSIERTSPPGRVRASFNGQGTVKGKPLHVRLKLRSFNGLYFVELVLTDRAYHRLD